MFRLWLTASAALALGCGGPRPCKNCSRRGEDLDARVPFEPVAMAPRMLAEADAACAVQSVRAEHGSRRPVDIVFVIDNSGSMAEEIAAVRRNIDQDFAAIIADSGVDYRVIMISRYGDDITGVCIDPPLGGAPCNQGLALSEGERYFHYDQEIGSYDGLCQILDTFDRADPSKRAPEGFHVWLREDAAKSFVMITDDDARCTYHDEQIQLLVGASNVDPFEDALAFHSALRRKSPAQFGGQYQFFSIVGVKGKEPEGDPLFPSDPLDPLTCNTAPAPGLGYQALSIATDALRYPVCEGRSFDAVFHALADSVIEASRAECTFQLPVVQAPETLILSSVNLEYRPGDGSEPQHFDQVADAGSCEDDHSFYIRDRIELCPRACRQLQRDKAPDVEILFGCARAPE